MSKNLNRHLKDIWMASKDVKKKNTPQHLSLEKYKLKLQ